MLDGKEVDSELLFEKNHVDFTPFGRHDFLWLIIYYVYLLTM